MSPPPVLLATSLVPSRAQALQAACVASWHAAGFGVISVNGAGEADAVRKQFSGVEVRAVPRTAEQFARKPVPYIHDIMMVLAESCSVNREECIVGIITADIFLRPVPALIPTIRREAPGAVLL